MRRAAKILLFLVLLAAGGGGAAWWFLESPAATDSPFLTQAVAVGDVEDAVSALGSLQPLNYVDVGTQVSGQLQKIHVDYGDAVK